jgi:hypothetical protein
MARVYRRGKSGTYYGDFKHRGRKHRRAARHYILHYRARTTATQATWTGLRQLP